MTIPDSLQRKRIDRKSSFSGNRQALVFFENEVHNLKRLSHHHLVKFVGSYTDKRYVGIIMQPVADTDLHQYLSKLEWTPDSLIVLRSFVGCLCSALDYLHQNKCRHKDLKPQNILIKGDTVLIADFGTAFDWSEFQSDVTVGAPDAFTKLYVAPEIAQHLARDMSSDIWSLGCVFLEIATILSGKSLESKSKYFSSLSSSSAAHWCNHEAIGTWIRLLEDAAAQGNEPIFQWIELMTKVDPSLRPTAAEIVTQQSSIAESIGSQPIIPEANDPKESEKGGQLLYTDRVRVRKDWHKGLSLPTAEASTTKSTHAIARKGVSNPEYSHISAISAAVESNQSNAERIVGYSELQSVEGQRRGERTIASVNVSSPLSQNLANDAQTPDDTWREGQPISTIVENLFFKSHQYFEECFISLRYQKSEWRKELTALMEKEPCDIKGFNILLVASKFNNSALAMDAVETVIVEDPTLINTATIFQNTALHYAAIKGRLSMIEFLIDRGAQTGLRNLHGRTALQLAIGSKQNRAAKILLRYLQPEDVNIPDVHGDTLLHHACLMDSLETVQHLIKAGADFGIRNKNGTSPVHISKINRGDVFNALGLKKRSHSRKLKSRAFKSQNDVHSKISEGFSIPNCTCSMCIWSTELRKANDFITPNGDLCLCQSHLTVYQTDSLSRYPKDAAKICLCKGCVAFRDYNSHYPSCGRPIFEDYTSYSDSSRSSVPVEPPFTETPTLPVVIDILNQPLPSYPGHQYYDTLIKQEFTATMSSTTQESRSVAYNALARAGFKGRKSYQTHPDRAMKWLITNFNSPIPKKEILAIISDFGADIDKAHWHGRKYTTLIEEALWSKDIGILQFLIKRNAQLERDPDYTVQGFSSLGIAVFHNFALGARMLLRAGANPNTKMMIHRREEKTGIYSCSPGASGSALLHHAVGYYGRIGWCIPLLLAHGASPEMLDENQETPLQLAVKMNNLFAINALLKGGAEIEAALDRSRRPLSIALSESHDEIVSTLLAHGANVHRTCGSMPCALFHAIQLGRQGTLALILKEYSGHEDLRRHFKSQDVLHLLARSTIQDRDLIDLILKHATNLNSKDDKGYSPLHMAVEHQHLCMIGCLLDRVVVENQDKPGTDLNAQNTMGWTPLHLAVSKGRREVVDILLRRGSQLGQHIDTQDIKGLTPLHLATKAGNAAMVSQLLNSGAIAVMQDVKGRTALDFARSTHNREIVQLLNGPMAKWEQSAE